LTAQAITGILDFPFWKRNQTRDSFVPERTRTAPEKLNAGQIEVDGARRQFLIYRPRTSKKLPVVLSLHGSFSSPKDMMRHTHLNPLADREGFIAVYPQLGHQLTLDVNDGQAIIDSHFIEALIDHLVKKEGADPGRVFATGFSSGADLLHFFATLGNLAEMFNAFAPVCSNMDTGWSQSVNHKHPVSMLMLSGTRDRLNKWKGQAPRWMSVPDTYKFWCEHNDAKSTRSLQNAFTETLDAFKHRAPSADGPTRLIVSQSLSEKNGSHIVLGKVLGGGHTWPGAQERNHLLRVICGATHSMHSANEIIWSFFQSRPSK